MPRRRLQTNPKTKERELVIRIAVGAYRFEPSARRSDTVSQIVDDMALAGVTIDAETVRKYLREAAQLLPGDRPTGED